MTIDQAIELLSLSANQGVTTFDEKYRAAQRLGIEALKAVGFIRTSYPGALTYPLPGETEE